ncbi:MAG: FAD binding domain-containing protein [Desulfitobacteriaceae bacterium]
MSFFRTFSPQNGTEALELLNEHKGDILPIAGGTNVLVDLHKGKISPRALIDLSKIQEWKTIQLTDGVLEIGSLVTHSEIEASLIIEKAFPALRMAASAVGSPQIRNRGTLAGNLQSASPAADCVPPLLALDSTLTLESATGHRELSIADFFLGEKKTVLKPNELISKISVKTNPNQRSVFLKAGLREALAISLVNLAVCLELDGENRCIQARVAFGSVAPNLIRAKGIEVFLKDRIIDGESVNEAGMLVQEEISPISDIRASAAYRRYLAKVLLQDAILTLVNARRNPYA